MMVIITTLQGRRKPIPPNGKRPENHRPKWPKYALGKAYDMLVARRVTVPIPANLLFFPFSKLKMSEGRFSLG